MPLYDYQCKKCNFIHEELRSMQERDKKAFCKKCQKKTSLPIMSGRVVIHNKESYALQSRR
jgi:putative FmdB family regulatory protein